MFLSTNVFEYYISLSAHLARVKQGKRSAPLLEIVFVTRRLRKPFELKDVRGIIHNNSHNEREELCKDKPGFAA